MSTLAESSPAARPRWRLVPTLGALLAGVALALVVMVLAVALHMRHVTIFNPNGWITARDIGSVETDTLTRAFIAQIGLSPTASQRPSICKPTPAIRSRRPMCLRDSPFSGSRAGSIIASAAPIFPRRGGASRCLE